MNGPRGHLLQGSRLGLGTMRFPVGADGRIQEVIAQEILACALELGIRYIDTGYNYLGGVAEAFLGQALRRYQSIQVDVVTKMPTWLIKTRDDFDRVFYSQLRRLRRDRLNHYLVHALNGESWVTMQSLGLLPWLDAKLETGEIGEVGFSFHDKFSVFRTILEGYSRWSVCQIQVNCLEPDGQAGLRGANFASGRNVRVIGMAPLGGGRLAKVDGEFGRALAARSSKWAPAALALSWVLSEPSISTTLVGANSAMDVRDALAVSQRGSLSGADRRLIRDISVGLRVRGGSPCSGCGYCEPCPSGVAIRGNIELLERLESGEAATELALEYLSFSENQKAGACTNCRRCIELCPQRVSIPESLAKATACFGAAMRET